MSVILFRPRNKETQGGEEFIVQDAPDMRRLIVVLISVVLVSGFATFRFIAYARVHQREKAHVERLSLIESRVLADAGKITPPDALLRSSEDLAQAIQDFHPASALERSRMQHLARSIMAGYYAMLAAKLPVAHDDMATLLLSLRRIAPVLPAKDAEAFSLSAAAWDDSVLARASDADYASANLGMLSRLAVDHPEMLTRVRYQKVRDRLTSDAEFRERVACKAAQDGIGDAPDARLSGCSLQRDTLVLAGRLPAIELYRGAVAAMFRFRTGGIEPPAVARLEASDSTFTRPLHK